MPNPDLPPEIADFREGFVDGSEERSSVEQFRRLHEYELRDVNQQITMRPLVAIFFGMLLFAQNTLIFALVAWSLEADKLGELQFVFSVLIGGTLAQTYKVSQLIVNKLFTPIDYKDKHSRFEK